MNLLEMRGIRKSFPGVRALDGVSFDLRAAEFHVLRGIQIGRRPALAAPVQA